MRIRLSGVGRRWLVMELEMVSPTASHVSVLRAQGLTSRGATANTNSQYGQNMQQQIKTGRTPRESVQL